MDLAFQLRLFLYGNRNSTKNERDEYTMKPLSLYKCRRYLSDYLSDTTRLRKRRVGILLGYVGTGYYGMQYNTPMFPTIESTLFDTLVSVGCISKDNSVDFHKNGFMRACRTDKGVHAMVNVISVKMSKYDEPHIKDMINKLLVPKGIRAVSYTHLDVYKRQTTYDQFSVIVAEFIGKRKGL